MKTDLRAKRWAEKYPDLGTAPIPTEPYISEDYFGLERDRVFARSWLNVGRVEEIPEAGDYFMREIAICRTAVLVMRGSDGVIRGFHNVCSHRSNRLVDAERGSCRGVLHCAFHDWGYSDKGELISVPDEENFFGLEKRDHGLTPVNTDIWEGFVFVHLGPDPSQSLRDYMGGLAQKLENCPFHKMKRVQTYRIEERANWKVGLDAQNELYHFPMLHGRCMGNLFMMNEESQCRYLDVTLYDRHSTWSCEYNPTVEPTPLTTKLFAFDGIIRSFEIPQMTGGMDFFTVFPNFAILLYRLGTTAAYLTYQFWPLAVDRTVWETRCYFTEPLTMRERLRHEYFKCTSADTLREDAAVHESVQTGLASRAKPHVILQDGEIAIRYFHKVLEDCVGFYRQA